MKVITEKVITEEVLNQMMSECVSSFRIVPRPWSRKEMAAVLRAAKISRCTRVYVHVSPCLLDRKLHLEFHREGTKGTKKVGWWLRKVIWRHGVRAQGNAVGLLQDAARGENKAPVSPRQACHCRGGR